MDTCFNQERKIGWSLGQWLDRNFNLSLCGVGFADENFMSIGGF